MIFKEIVLLSTLLFIFGYVILNRICDCIEHCRDSKSMASTFENLKIDPKNEKNLDKNVLHKCKSNEKN